MAKPEYVRGMSATNADYFEKGRGHGSDYDKGSNQYTGNEKLQDGYSRVAHQDAPDPVAYTQTRTARKGGGFDLGEKQYIYEKVKQKEAPAQQAPTPEPEAPAEPAKDKGPVELSPEITQAKERVAAYKMDGNAGSTFSTEASAPAEASAAGSNSVSFAPAKIDTPTYNPNAGEEAAQGLADKYKLNLINKGIA